MARTTATNFSGGLQFPYATAATDVFKKEDVQTLAQAVDQHDHTAGKGKSVAPVAGSITNAMLGSDVARANLLTNGGFEIWQRGSGPFTASSAFTSDRWQIGLDGSDTLSVSRDAVNIDVASGNCAAVTFVKGSGSLTTLYQVLQPNADVWGVRGKTVSLSVRVRTSTASTARAYINNNGTVVYSAFHSGGGTYETLTVTATVTALPAVFNVGVGFTGGSATAYLDNAMLVVGSQPADYAPLHPADDLARCLRYYEVIGDTANGVPLIGTYTSAGATSYTNVFFAAKKAITPTCTKTGTWTAVNAGQPSFSAPSAHGVLGAVVVTSTGLGYGVPGAAGQNLVAESNP